MKQMKRLVFLLFLSAIIVILVACGGNTNDDNTNNQESADQEEMNTEQETEDTQKSEVELNNGDGESVGTAILKEVSDGVEVTLEGENLPKGTLAFHIHEKGQCEAPDFKSAGGHFNPEDTNHGFEDPDGPHAGDMPNIVVGEEGTVKQSFLVRGVTLKKDESHSLLDDDGTSLVIHKGADDGKSQPSGDAGDRLACGSISNEKSQEK